MIICLKILPLFLFFLLNLTNNSESLKILQIVPGVSTSHAIFNYRIAESLTQNGHNVTLLTVTHFLSLKSSVKPPKNVKEFRIRADIGDGNVEFVKETEKMAFEEFHIVQFVKTLKFLGKSLLAACKQILNDGDLLKNLGIGDQGFDIALVHFFDACPLFVAHLLKINKIVWLSPANFILDYVAEATRIPHLPSFVPGGMLSFSDHMSFMDRVKNFAFLAGVTLRIRVPFGSFMHEENAYFRAPPHGDRPHMFDLMETVSLLYVNGEVFIDFPRPLPMGVNYLGEMGAERMLISENKIGDLDEPWNSICQVDNKGIILFSLGTIANTSNMPDYMSEAFRDAFKEFPNYSIIWRIEKKIPLADKYKHIHVTTWVPQRQLLEHPRTRLFITHGGYNSLLETTKAGVPVIVMPLFTDQFPNAKRAVMRGLGLTLDKTALTSHVIQHAMTMVLNDNKFANNARKLAHAMDDKLINPDKMLSHRLEMFVKAKWFPTLKAGQRLSLMEYMCIDVAVFTVMAVMFTLFGFVKFIA